MRINIVTLFPEFFREPLRLSIPGRAAQAGLAEYRLVDLRDFTHDRHRTVDDYPYGGGAGMVLKPEPFWGAVEFLTGEAGELRAPLLLMSARGRRFVHEDAVRWSLADELTLLCGHYKDVDQRVAEGLGAEEISLGDFVLSGGEPAALAIVDADGSTAAGRDLGSRIGSDGFALRRAGSVAPSYTRPAEFRGLGGATGAAEWGPRRVSPRGAARKRPTG